MLLLCHRRWSPVQKIAAITFTMNMVSPSTSVIIGCIFLFTILVIGNIISRSRLSSSEFYPGINAISSKSTVSIKGQNEVMNDTQRNNHYRFNPFLPKHNFF
mgnify:CR=1 FL=1